ncbi:MAG: K+/H+ antiporter [Sorangiineae bacterium NIC37A_2]|nr:MAG: K+/H+ antiporter [Sorangiineae bacterium NIC37A_2]
MFLIDKLLLVGSLLMILGILSSKFSARAGLPVLVLFLGLGMLAGSDGIGKIAFDNFATAHAIGTVALAFILFDGGLRTPLENLKLAWRPSAALATLGVFVTSAVTGVVAMYVLDISLLEGLLLGSIVGSTDAAAVFALLRSAGVHLRKRIGATLEIESGANDPMAIFLTVGLIEVLTGEVELGPGLLRLFVMQMGVGLGVGFLLGKLSVRLINRINLAAAGLYPVLTAACGVFSFGLAAALDGSGFLAVYIAGIVLGNSKLVFQKGTLLFHDGIAWAGQIVMFVVLGLLSSPRALLEVAGPSLLVAVALTFLARPLAVLPILLPFKFSARELTLISWVGLKGAVPIILATYPLMSNLEAGSKIFNVVFFVVLISALVQGGTLPWMARTLGLEEPPTPEPPLSLEIMALQDVDAEIIDYAVGDESPVAGRLLRDLALPEGAVVAMIARDRMLIPPRGTTEVRSRDHLFIVANREARAPVDAIFARRHGERLSLPRTEFSLRGTTTVADLALMYGIPLNEAPERTLEEVVRRHSIDVVSGTTVTVDGVRLTVRELVEGEVLSVGLLLEDEFFESSEQLGSLEPDAHP